MMNNQIFNNLSSHLYISIEIFNLPSGIGEGIFARLTEMSTKHQYKSSCMILPLLPAKTNAAQVLILWVALGK